MQLLKACVVFRGISSLKLIKPHFEVFIGWLIIVRKKIASDDLFQLIVVLILFKWRRLGVRNFWFRLLCPKRNLIDFVLCCFVVCSDVHLEI